MIKMNACYSRMANPRGGQCSLTPYRQVVTKFILHLRLSLTPLADVGTVCKITSREQWVVSDSAPAVTVQCCLHHCPCLTFPAWAPWGAHGSAPWVPPDTSRVTSGSWSRQVAALLDSWNQKTWGFLFFGVFPSIKAVLKSRQHFFLNIYLFIYGKRKFKRWPAFCHCRYIMMCPTLSGYFKVQRWFCKSVQNLPEIVLWAAKRKKIRNRSC